MRGVCVMSFKCDVCSVQPRFRLRGAEQRSELTSPLVQPADGGGDRVTGDAHPGYMSKKSKVSDFFLLMYPGTLSAPGARRLRRRSIHLLLLLLPLGAAREPRHSPGGAPCGGGSLRPRPRRRRRLSSPVAVGGWSPEGEDGSPPGTGTSAARVPASPPPLYLLTYLLTYSSTAASWAERDPKIRVHAASAPPTDWTSASVLREMVPQAS